ncbi:ropporin-1-like protein [Octopus sinensis]|nr:ropporin-1-like protein [Octopus sinensis]XP_036358871.1 ropporin-1-like protein [Octopus sinensis]
MPVSNNDEPYYCSEQIKIPLDLPDIMKEFTKAAIRTQPKDILGWSTSYFVALYNGEEPPVKERYEIPMATQKTDSGLTIGILKIFHKQLSSFVDVTRQIIEEKWEALSLPKELLDEILHVGNLNGMFSWREFLVIAVVTISIDIQSALKNICDIITDDPEGGPSRILYNDFEFFFNRFIQLDGGIPAENAKELIAYFKMTANKNNGFVQPSFFKASDCPTWSMKD